MTLSQFHELDSQTQAKVIVEKGVLLGERAGKYHDFELLQIDGFYVEVKYLRDSRNILSFKPFSTSDLLDPYIAQIDISQFNK